VRNSVAGTTIAGFEYQTDRLGLRVAITDTLPLSPTLSPTRITTAAFEAASLTDPVTGMDSVQQTATAVVLTTTNALKGSYSAVVPNLGNSYLRKEIADADDLYVTFYVRVSSLPSNNTRILQISNGGTTVAEIQLTTAGKLRFRNAGTSIGLDSAALTVGSIYRVGVHQKKGTGANAVLEAYLASGDAPFTSPFSAATNQTFTTAATRVNLGATTSTAAAIALDDITFDTATLPQPGQSLAMRGLSSAGISSDQAGTSLALPQPDAATNGRAAALAALPLSFVPNTGQIDDARMRFQARGLSGQLSFGAGTLTMVLRTPTRDKIQPPRDTPPQRGHKVANIPPTRVQQSWLASTSTAEVTGTLNLPGRANAFVGNNPAKWRTNLPMYAGLVTHQLYAGIDLHYTGTDGQLKATYVVAPGADPSRIRWRYQGADTVQVDKAGNLVVSLPAPASTLTDTEALSSTLTELAPVAWQTINEREVAVPVRFNVGPAGIVSFVLGTYDTTVPLIIDPTLLYSTYLSSGGVNTDFGSGIAVDAVGNTYITGGFAGSAFVDKLNSTGSAVLFSTTFGDNYTSGEAIALDSAGNTYVTGATTSLTFPTLNGYQTTCNPGNISQCSPLGDAFLTKLSTTGVILYSTYLGGSGAENGLGIAADNSGSAYITGATDSIDFPTKTPIQTCPAGDTTCGQLINNFRNINIVVSKINTTASGTASLIYSTYLGGQGKDYGWAIAIDASGSAYVAGVTDSTNFPTTSGVIRPTHTVAENDAVVIKLTAAGTAKAYATYLGGSNTDSALGIVADSAGNSYITGFTRSPNFPLVNAYQAACGDTSCAIGDAYLVKLNPSASTMLYSTYLGGNQEDAAWGIALDTQQAVYLIGTTISPNFPITSDGFRPVVNGSQDAFVAKMDTNSGGIASVIYSTVFGGNNNDEGNAIAVDATGNAYITGGTLSNNLATPGAAQTSYSGSQSAAYVAKIGTPTRTLSYVYDGLQRLIGANERPGSVYTYTYDLAGNRTAVQLNGGTPATTTYNNANQITNSGYTYDNAGNLLNDGTAAYTYDALSRTTVRGTTTYAYNGDGTLVSQLTGGVTTRYTQDLAAPLSQVLQTQVGGATRTDYIYGLNRLASLNGSTKIWYVADALGSVRRSVADNGTPLGIINYDPWGTPESGSVPTFGFTGEIQDVGAGLVNLRARWYSTARGRFTSVDPFAGMPETPYSLHQYQYGYSDPVGKTDPSGKNPLCLIPAVAGPVGVGVTAVCAAVTAAFAAATIYLVGDSLDQMAALPVQGPYSTAGAVPPPPPVSPPPTAPNPDVGKPHVLGNPGLSHAEQQLCQLPGFSLDIPTGPYTSGRWETPIQMPLALMQSLAGLPPIIKAVTKAEKPADVERILHEANVPFSVRISDWRVPFEPVYELGGFGRPVEIRVHLNEDLTIAQYRIGIQLVEPGSPVYPKAGQIWLPAERDMLRLLQADEALIQAFGVPVNEFAPRSGGWEAQYIDPLGWVYVDAQGHLIGLRSNAGHINRIP
jgi:RHS repeat-associated protein